VTTADTVMAEVGSHAVSLAVAGDPAALAGALSRDLALSVDQRAQRSRVARARAEEFSWEYSLAQHLEAYELAREG